MEKERIRWFVAGVLLLGTAVAGGVARSNSAVSSGGAVSTVATSTAGVTLAGTLDRTAVLRGGDGTARMELVIAANSASGSEHTHRPTDLVVILDRSGSMAGEKIVNAQAAVYELISHMRPQDRFALVSYASDVRVDLPLAHLNETNRGAALEVVGEIFAGGGTNMSSGIDAAFALIGPRHDANRVKRVILISDGLANEGDPSPQGLIARARRAAAGEFAMSAVGVGTDFNEYLMTALADAGTGSYYYVRHSEDLGAVFASEFGAARDTVASGLAVHIRPAAGVRVTDAAGYPLEQRRGTVTLRPGSLFAGQERRIWLTLAVPTGELAEYDLGDVSLRFVAGGEEQWLRLDAIPKVACVAAEEEFYANIDADAWGRSVAVDDYYSMQDEVAREVKAGNRDKALGILREFRDRVEEQNRYIAAPAVAAKLEEAGRLEGEVERAFVGDERKRAQQQNLLSKSKSAEAHDARRGGAKKEQGK